MACRIQKTGEWQTRILCEKHYYSDHCFLTLTYDDDHVPPGETLVKFHLQNFFKRLRYHVDVPFKHFSVGEYGDVGNRPHYHSLILGWFPPSVLPVYPGSKSMFSPLIRKVWPFGFNMVGVVEQKSIDYVTGYIRKKLYGPPSKEIYGFRLPPFQLRSINIGKRYALEHRDEIVKNNGVVINGKNRGINRYFWKLLELPEELAIEMQEERQRNIDVEIQVRNLSDYAVFDDRSQREKNLSAKEKLFQRGKL